MITSQYNKLTVTQIMHAEGLEKCFLLKLKIGIILKQTSLFI